MCVNALMFVTCLPRRLRWFELQVVVNVQFPKVVRTADLHVTAGTCLFDEALKVKKRFFIYLCSRMKSPGFALMVTQACLNVQRLLKLI